MTTKKPISWFLTDKGRKFSFTVITGTGLALTTAKFAPHIFLIDKYKEFVHYYQDSKPVTLSPELQKRYKKCLDIIDMADSQKKIVSPFSVFGFDLFHAGSWQSRFGAIVGIPVHFSYKTLADIKKDDIQVNNKKVDWNSEAGKKLADALLLSEKVQEFAICREILSTLNSKVYLQATYPFTAMFFAYTFSSSVNKKLNLYAVPAAPRVILYTLTGLFSLGLYFFLTDYTEVYYETVVDKKLCELGTDFIESGVVFYNKMLKRNQALRELMGKEGETKYTKMGNENFGIRQPRLALVHRRQFFEDKLLSIGNEEAAEQKI